ncbi:MAG: flavin reductase family protein [Lachnospiraceae bacterium]|nr:flavin reductase family protein [Lachnospiraceae bacterium]
MRKNFGSKSWMYPMPVLIIGTYNEVGVPNAMNAAWGMISDYDKVSVCLDASHKTVKNILEKKAFTVSMADAKNVVAADYVGIVSGNDVPDKMERAGWHAVKSEFVDAPLFEELPMTLECKMLSYDEETELMTGEIVNVSVDESILGEDGKIDLTKFSPITYDPVHHDYVKLGEKVGNAFKDGKALK